MDGDGPAELDDERAAIEALVEHQHEHRCCRVDKLGRERSGSGCPTERALWADTGMSRARGAAS